MIRMIGLLLLVCVVVVLPATEASAHDSVADAIIGAGTGAIIGGMATGRADGVISGAVVGANAASIFGTEPEKRPGYSWRNGDCYRRVRDGYVRVTRRLCN